jgi:hypothetical protein
VLAQTATIERHVIRAEVPGLVIELSEPAAPERLAPGPSEAGLAWRDFVEQFAREMRFDDPGQPPPRAGGVGWIKLPLPGGLYVNLYRSQNLQRIGAEVRFTGVEGDTAYAELAADREAIDAEFITAELTAPDWLEGEVPRLSLVMPSMPPWSEARSAEQRQWFARVGNQFINSLRPRLQRRAAQL